jgi:serine phosphatase RsbU (regulator of sigma subunit)
LESTIEKPRKSSYKVGISTYPVRIIGYLLCTGSIYSLYQFELGVIPISVCIFMVIINLYPHVAFGVYMWKGQKRNYEFTNFVIDMFWIGMITNVLHFSPFYALPYILSNSASTLASNGLPLMLKGFGALLIGIAISFIFFDFYFDTSPILEVASFGIAYLILAVYYISYLSYTKGTAIRKNKKKIEDQNLELQFQKDSLTVLNEEITQQNEEIIAQRDSIEMQNELLKRQKDALESANQSIKESIIYAERIQQAVLPSENTIKAVFDDAFVFYRPKNIVSGDFYWFKYSQAEPHIVWFAVADCTGHGVPGAFMSLIGQSLLAQTISDMPNAPLSSILTETSNRVTQQLQQNENKNKDGMHIGLVKIDYRHQTIYYVGSKHSLVYTDKNDELHFIKGEPASIGGEMLRKAIFTEHTLHFDKIKRFYLFSDGYQDQFGGAENKKFGTRRLHHLLAKIQSYSLKEQGKIIAQEIEDWQMAGNEKQIDDILVAGIDILSFKYKEL